MERVERKSERLKLADIFSPCAHLCREIDSESGDPSRQLEIERELKQRFEDIRSHSKDILGNMNDPAFMDETLELVGGLGSSLESLPADHPLRREGEDIFGTIVSEGMTRIEVMIMRQELGKSGMIGEAFAVLGNLIKVAKRRKDNSGEAWLNRATDLIKKTSSFTLAKFEEYANSSYEPKKYRHDYLPALETLLLVEDESIDEATASAMITAFDNPSIHFGLSSEARHVVHWVDELIKDKIEKGIDFPESEGGVGVNMTRVAGKLTAKFMEKHHLPFLEDEVKITKDSFIKDWFASASNVPDQVPSFVFSNIKTIRDLDASRSSKEEERVWAAAELYKMFGITCFGRYPIDMLVWQFDERNKDDRPYGTMMSMRSDSKGGAYLDKPKFQAFFLKFKTDCFSRLGKPMAWRVFEVGSGAEALRMARTLREKYPEHKSKFLIVSAHGEPDSIVLGSGKKGTLEQAFVEKSTGSAGLISKIDDILDEEASVMLVSCSAGGEGNIAESISKRLGPKRKVLAHEKIISIRSLSAQINEQANVTFDVRLDAWKKKDDGTFEWDGEDQERGDAPLVHSSGSSPQRYISQE